MTPTTAHAETIRTLAEIIAGYINDLAAPTAKLEDATAPTSEIDAALEHVEMTVSHIAGLCTAVNLITRGRTER